MIEGQSSPRWDRQTLASALLIRTHLDGEKLLTGLHVCSTSLTKGSLVPVCPSVGRGVGGRLEVRTVRGGDW